jgi:hypothetical protein
VPPTDVSIEHDGKTYTGSYRHENGGLTISYGGRTKRVHQGGMTDDTLIRMMLSEPVGESLQHRRWLLETLRKP